MSTFVKECESCKVDGYQIILRTLREVRGLAGFWLVKGGMANGQEVTLAVVGSSAQAGTIISAIASRARENPGASLAILGGIVEARPAKLSPKGGAA